MMHCTDKSAFDHKTDVTLRYTMAPLPDDIHRWIFASCGPHFRVAPAKQRVSECCRPVPARQRGAVEEG